MANKRHASRINRTSPVVGEEGAVVRPAHLSFDMVKGNNFRGVHADGVWGGATPQGLLSFTFFSERFPIPQQVTHVIRPDGTLGDEVIDARVTRQAIVRDAEVCVYMTLPVASAFRDLISEHIDKLERSQQTQKKDVRENAKSK